MPNSQVYEIPDHVEAREVSGELVILDLKENTYYGLDEVGALIWQGIADQVPMQVTVAKITEAYDVDPTQAASDAEALIQSLLSEGLLEPSES